MLYRFLMETRKLDEGIKLYHGSKSNHGRFTIPHIGNNSHTFGAYNSERHGVFFSDNPNIAKIYGDVDVYDLSVAPKEIAILDNSNIIYYFVQYLRDTQNEYYQDARNLQHTWQYFEDEVGREFVQYLRKQGYKAARFEEYIEDDDGDEHKSNTYVLLDLNRVRRNPDPNQYDLFLK